MISINSLQQNMDTYEFAPFEHIKKEQQQKQIKNSFHKYDYLNQLRIGVETSAFSAVQFAIPMIIKAKVNFERRFGCREIDIVSFLRPTAVQWDDENRHTGSA